MEKKYCVKYLLYFFLSQNSNSKSYLKNLRPFISTTY